VTTQKAVDILNILIDKYGSPSVDEDERVDMLNMAMFEYLNRLVPDNQGGVVNFEFDSNVIHNIKPLIYTITANMDADGLLEETDIDTALRTESSDATATVLRIMSIGITDDDDITRPVKYVKQNNLWSQARNFFKRPSATNPRYTMMADGLKFYPTNQTDDLTITVLKNPKLLSLSPASNPELADYAFYNVIMIALKLCGIEIRDDQMLQDIRLTALQNSQ
jgi:hypothetical protein